MGFTDPALKKRDCSGRGKKLSEWRRADENESLYSEIVSLWKNIITDSAAYNPDTHFYWEQMKIRIESTGKKKTTVLPVRTLHMVAAAVVLLFLSVFSSYFITRNYYRPYESLQTYKAVNGKSQMTLPDGSTVWLNVGSEITYKTTFLKDRRVTLDGEALFDVKKDNKHPFMVSTGEVEVKVHGTLFNVKSYAKKEAIRIALLEGKVSASALEQLVYMEPGEVVTFDKNTFRLSKTKSDVDFDAFWAKNSYTFNAQPLSYICKYLERWYNISIELDPVIADSQIYTFTVSNEALETILQNMARINPIQYSFEEDNRVIITNFSP